MLYFRTVFLCHRRSDEKQVIIKQVIIIYFITNLLMFAAQDSDYIFTLFFSIFVSKQILSKNMTIYLLKIPVDQMTSDERMAAVNEVTILKMLNHPNIIEYYESFLADKAMMIVMEYAEGLLQSCNFAP